MPNQPEEPSASRPGPPTSPISLRRQPFQRMPSFSGAHIQRQPSSSHVSSFARRTSSSTSSPRGKPADANQDKKRKSISAAHVRSALLSPNTSGTSYNTFSSSSGATNHPGDSRDGAVHHHHKRRSSTHVAEALPQYDDEETRMWYDQFTSTDWLRDTVADSYRTRHLRSKRGLYYRLYRVYDASQGWILSALCGVVVALIAYFIDTMEETFFDFKNGYCSTNWLSSAQNCCASSASSVPPPFVSPPVVTSYRRQSLRAAQMAECRDWQPWADLLPQTFLDREAVEFIVYTLVVMALSGLACVLTMTTKTFASSASQLVSVDENFAAASDPDYALPSSSALPFPPSPDQLTSSMSIAPSNAAAADTLVSPFTIEGGRPNAPATIPVVDITRATPSNDLSGLNTAATESYYPVDAAAADSNLDRVPPSVDVSARSSVDSLSTSSTIDLAGAVAAAVSVPSPMANSGTVLPSRFYYPAAGSGVAEVRVILSGYVLHGFLGFHTLLIKTLALVPSVASGMSLGKEGPYVHIATCVGNIACRLFPKYDNNDAKRREVLSAAAAAGVVVAFGAPLGGVLFGLEEVSYFFPAKTLFRTFFCCITAALTLKFLNPYGTHKIVLFEVSYADIDWHVFEMAGFVLIGVLGGALGALFIKASNLWARSFRTNPIIKASPLFEVLLVALVTAVVNFWSYLTRLPVAELLFELAAPCPIGGDGGVPAAGERTLCPTELAGVRNVVRDLTSALVIKSFLTVITFGLKLPAGIYVPSMVTGGLLGRVVGHVIQYCVLKWPDFGPWATCAASSPGSCIQPGVYGLIAAGATMCGVTRLSVTLAVILFELTGSLDYVLPISLAVLVAKWTADAIEPNSIYDLLTIMNNYPFLENKHRPVFTSLLADMVPPRLQKWHMIDITESPVIAATRLRAKVELLHRVGELDGGLPIVRNGVLVGLIPAPDLEYALDHLQNEPEDQCLMASSSVTPSPSDTLTGDASGVSPSGHPYSDSSDEEEQRPVTPGERHRTLHHRRHLSQHVDPTDFTPYIDPAPIALDIHSPMDIVYECFAKLGLRYVCVLHEGRFVGMVHKKSFVKYVREKH